MDLDHARRLLPFYFLDSECNTSPEKRIPSYVHLHPWEDGFTPSACNDKPGKIMRDLPRSSPNLLKIIDAAVSEETADLLYRSACDSKVWGHYIPKSQLTISKDQKLQSHTISSPFQNSELDQRELCRRAIEDFLVSKAQCSFSASELDFISGISVWAIASDVSNEIAYHLDYAESVRYETNVIVPPLYSATLHVSPFQEKAMRGGDFYVNVQGLKHYQKFGYKSRLMPMDEKKDPQDGWIEIPYKYRRGIVFNGEFPHLSSKVQTLPEKGKRVIVGFNLISPEIEAFVSALPEHSKAFNKYVRLSQTAIKRCEWRWTLDELRKDKKRAKLVCFLARKLKEIRNG